MKVFLMHQDRDFDIKAELRDKTFEAMMSGNTYALGNLRRNLKRAGTSDHPTNTTPDTDEVLTQDLELETLWDLMADGDEFIFETVRRAVLTPLRDPESIIYRQRVLADVLEHSDVVRQLYDLALEALENERHAGPMFWNTQSPQMILQWSVRVLIRHLDVLHRLRTIADDEPSGMRSEGFARFFDMVRHELDDDYLALLEQELHELTFNRGILESARLGPAGHGRDYLVHRLPEQSWTERLGLGQHTPGYSFTIAPRDEAGLHALAEIRSRGLNQVADARKGEPTCFPVPIKASERALTATGLYDVCLTLHLDARVVGNDLAADGTRLIVITGANQGGKSTMLRSLGLAHLMMQAGLFVGGQSFRASIRAGVFTHYKREEDNTMRSGKLDEELSRMSQIADHITKHSLLLCNESFASTNEREGSEIARQVIRAMLDNDITVVLVTHMYDLAHHLHTERADGGVFLRAEREPDGHRTFHLIPGEPLPTSYGKDTYQSVFGPHDNGVS